MGPALARQSSHFLHFNCAPPKAACVCPRGKVIINGLSHSPPTHGMYLSVLKCACWVTPRVFSRGALQQTQLCHDRLPVAWSKESVPKLQIFLYCPVKKKRSVYVNLLCVVVFFFLIFVFFFFLFDFF